MSISEYMILSGNKVTFRIDCFVDGDDHLNIYVSLPDDPADSLIDTDGFPISPLPGEELIYRLTTKKTEEAYNEKVA